MTKADMSAQLKAAGVAHDPTAPVATLKALVDALPENKGVVTETDGQSREDRWAAFLVEARKVNPERFDRQEANGEFKTIPDSFK